MKAHNKTDSQTIFYTVKELADLAGITPRTLRYYDEIGLLPPERMIPTDRMDSSGYRMYGPDQTDILWQILFYRRLGLHLKDIKALLDNPSYHRAEALKSHLKDLTRKRDQLNLLIDTVKQIITSEGEAAHTMTDQEKFMCLKENLIHENDKKYGKEIRETYGVKAVQALNAKVMGLSQKEYEAMETLGEQILRSLEKAVTKGLKPDSDAGSAIAALHKEWLSYTWSSYSIEAHRALVSMYLEDSRFQAYYDKNIPGCAEFLKNAVCLCTVLS